MPSRRSVIVILLIACLTSASAPAQKPPTSKWAAPVESRVESLLSQMTLEEKIDLLGGVDGFFIRGLARPGLPPLKMADGPLRVRNYGPATAMAAFFESDEGNHRRPFQPLMARNAFDPARSLTGLTPM